MNKFNIFTYAVFKVILLLSARVSLFLLIQYKIAEGSSKPTGHTETNHRSLNPKEIIILQLYLCPHLCSFTLLSQAEYLEYFPSLIHFKHLC